MSTAGRIGASLEGFSMRLAGRGERITEATLHWNADKRARMAQALARRCASDTRFHYCPHIQGCLEPVSSYTGSYLRCS